MRKNKSLLAMAMVMVMVVTLLAGCASSSEPEVTTTPDSTESEATTTPDSEESTGGIEKLEPTTLKITSYYVEGTGTAIIDVALEAIEKFKQDHPEIDLIHEATPTVDNYGTQIKTLAAGNALPDAMIVNASIMKEFVANGQLMPLDDVLNENNEWVAGFLPNSFAEFIIDGKTYGVPTNIFSVHMIYWNKEIFAEVGLNEFPKSWDEFLSAIQKLEAAGYVPIAMGNKPKWVIGGLLFPTLANRFTGSDWFDEIKTFSGKAKFTDPEFIAALQALKQLTDMKAFNDDVQSIDYPIAQQYYSEKKAAMAIDGAWSTGAYKTLPEDVFNATEIAVLPGGVPNQKGNSNAVHGGSGWTWAINSQTDKAKTAAFVELLKYIYNEENSIKALEKGGQPPYKYDLTQVTLEPLNQKYFDLMKDKEVVQIYDQQLLPSLVDILYSGIQEMMIGSTTPEKLAQKLQEEQEKLMEQNK
jgi:raffinose/stachyose/melibiose transport system substrate-binding protein